MKINFNNIYPLYQKELEQAISIKKKYFNFSSRIHLLKAEALASACAIVELVKLPFYLIKLLDIRNFSKNLNRAVSLIKKESKCFLAIPICTLSIILSPSIARFFKGWMLTEKVQRQKVDDIEATCNNAEERLDILRKTAFLFKTTKIPVEQKADILKMVALLPKEKRNGTLLHIFIALASSPNQEERTSILSAMQGISKDKREKVVRQTIVPNITAFVNGFHIAHVLRDYQG